MSHTCKQWKLLPRSMDFSTLGLVTWAFYESSLWKFAEVFATQKFNSKCFDLIAVFGFRDVLNNVAIRCAV